MGKTMPLEYELQKSQDSSLAYWGKIQKFMLVIDTCFISLGIEDELNYVIIYGDK